MGEELNDSKVKFESYSDIKFEPSFSDMKLETLGEMKFDLAFGDLMTGGNEGNLDPNFFDSKFLKNASTLNPLELNVLANGLNNANYSSNSSNFNSLEDGLSDPESKDEAPSGSKRSRKSPRVRRPMNSFMLFSNQYRSVLQFENKERTNTQISKLLGEAWKSMPLEAKKPYMERAAKIKADFNAAHPDYVYTKTIRKKHKRKPGTKFGDIPPFLSTTTTGSQTSSEMRRCLSLGDFTSNSSTLKPSVSLSPSTTDLTSMRRCVSMSELSGEGNNNNNVFATPAPPGHTHTIITTSNNVRRCSSCNDFINEYQGGTSETENSEHELRRCASANEFQNTTTQEVMRKSVSWGDLNGVEMATQNNVQQPSEQEQLISSFVGSNSTSNSSTGGSELLRRVNLSMNDLASLGLLNQSQPQKLPVKSFMTPGAAGQVQTTAPGSTPTSSTTPTSASTPTSTSTPASTSTASPSIPAPSAGRATHSVHLPPHIQQQIQNQIQTTIQNHLQSQFQAQGGQLPTQLQVTIPLTHLTTHIDSGALSSQALQGRQATGIASINELQLFQQQNQLLNSLPKNNGLGSTTTLQIPLELQLQLPQFFLGTQLQNQDLSSISQPTNLSVEPVTLLNLANQNGLTLNRFVCCLCLFTFYTYFLVSQPQGSQVQNLSPMQVHLGSSALQQLQAQQQQLQKNAQQSNVTSMHGTHGSQQALANMGAQIAAMSLNQTSNNPMLSQNNMLQTQGSSNANQTGLANAQPSGLNSGTFPSSTSGTTSSLLSLGTPSTGNISSSSNGTSTNTNSQSTPSSMIQLNALNSINSLNFNQSQLSALGLLNNRQLQQQQLQQQQQQQLQQQHQLQQQQFLQMQQIQQNHLHHLQQQHSQHPSQTQQNQQGPQQAQQQGQSQQAQQTAPPSQPTTPQSTQGQQTTSQPSPQHQSVASPQHTLSHAHQQHHHQQMHIQPTHVHPHQLQTHGLIHGHIGSNHIQSHPVSPSVLQSDGHSMSMSTNEAFDSFDFLNDDMSSF